jgi:hypothetical protein
MDYSKKGGGTRVHDALRFRTQATGMGQTETSNREHGSQRANDVAQSLKPGQIVHDHGLRELRDRKVKMDAMHRQMTGLDPTSPRPPEEKWPLESGSCTHADCDTMQEHQGNDQGEQTRVGTTGRHHGARIMATPLRQSAPLSQSGK